MSSEGGIYTLRHAPAPPPDRCNVPLTPKGDLPRSDEEVETHPCGSHHVFTIEVADEIPRLYCEKHLILALHYLGMCAFQQHKYFFKSYRIEKTGAEGRATFMRTTLEVGRT